MKHEFDDDKIIEREIQEIEDAAEDFESEDYKYIAFISYRHLEPDASIAKKIHTMIETFKLPKEFVVNGKQPKFKVFRDREELSASSLTDSIDFALNNSKFLIVICSKQLPLSEWCNREVETFIKLHGVERVVPVLIEGEPSESFPDALLNNETEVTLDDGSVVVENKDILAAELRPSEVMDPDFIGYQKLAEKDPAKLKELTNKSKKLLKTEIYRVMAAILGVSYGDLIQRDKVRKQKRLLALSTIISAALLFFGIFMVNAYKAENIAKRQTIQDRSQFMLDEANDLLLEGDRFSSIELAQQAMSDLDDRMENYNNLKSEHYQILNNAMNLTESTFNKVIETNNQFTFIDVHKKNNYFVVGMDNDSVGLFDIASGKEIKRFLGHKQQVKLVSYANNQNIFASGGFDDIINIWNLDNNELMYSVVTPGNVMLMQFSNDDKYLEVIYDTIENYVYQRYSVENLEKIGNSIILRRNINRVIFDINNENMWINYSTTREDSSLIKYNLETGEEIPIKDRVEENSLLFSDISSNNQENNTYDENQIINIPYTDFRRSLDKKYLYILSSSNIIKVDLETEETVYEIKDAVYGVKNSLVMAEDSINNKLYIPDGIKLKIYDSISGTFLKEIYVGEAVIDIKISNNETNNVLALLGESGTITILKDDNVQEQVANINSSNLQYIYITHDGNYVMTLSLIDRQVKILEILPSEQKEIINGQIAGISQNRNYSLYYENGELFIWDNINKERKSIIDNEIFKNYSSILLDGTAYSITDDGKRISGVTKKSNDIIFENEEIFVYDVSKDEVIYTIPAPKGTFNYTFSQDGLSVFVTTAFNEITVYSVENQTELKKIIVEDGLLSGISISKDNRYLAVNYTEGISAIYDIETSQKLGEVNGKSLYIENDGDLNIVSVYNNVGTIYKNFEEVSTVILSKERDKYGSNFNDRDYYNKEKNLLLTIKNKDRINYIYLLDFNTGDLIKSFVIPISGYYAKGYISPNGEDVYLDYLSNNFEDKDGKYNYVSKSLIFPIKSYDELNEEALNLIDRIK